MAHSVYAML